MFEFMYLCVSEWMCTNSYLCWLCLRQILTPSYFRALRGMLLIAVGERERTPRPSRRVALSNDTLRDPVRLRRSLRRCAANQLEVSFIYMYNGICVIIEKLFNCVFVYVCVSVFASLDACMCMHDVYECMYVN